MNVVEEVEKLIVIYQTDSVRDLADYLDISIQYQDFRAKTVDSRLMIIDAKGFIFLRNDLDIIYENFLIAHEIGHYILHYDENISFNFLIRIYKTRLEREANEFACALLLHDRLDNIKKIENIEFVVKEKGIPLKIWYSIVDQI